MLVGRRRTSWRKHAEVALKHSRSARGDGDQAVRPLAKAPVSSQGSPMQLGNEYLLIRH